MFFQHRGNVYLRELDADNNPGPARLKLCTDAFGIGLSTEVGTHINKCGAVDVEDDRYTKSNSATVTLRLATLDDKFLAFGVFGTVNAQSSPGTVNDEALPTGIEAGDFVFLGGKTRHRNITALVLTDTGSPGGTLVADTDYTLDALSGRVTFITAPDGAVTADYGYTDPASVTLLNAGQKRFALDYEYINKRNANKPGSLEVYTVIFDPAQNLDFQSDDLQVMELTGSALADTTREADDELGQFGRRVTQNALAA